MSAGFGLWRVVAGRSWPITGFVVLALASSFGLWLQRMLGTVWFAADTPVLMAATALLVAAAMVWWLQLGLTLRDLRRGDVHRLLPAWRTHLLRHVVLTAALLVALPVLAALRVVQGSVHEFAATLVVIALLGLFAMNPLRVLGMWLLACLLATLLGRWLAPGLLEVDPAQSDEPNLGPLGTYAALVLALGIEAALRWPAALRRAVGALVRGEAAAPPARGWRWACDDALLREEVERARQSPSARQRLLRRGLLGPPLVLRSRRWWAWQWLAIAAMLATSHWLAPNFVIAWLFGFPIAINLWVEGAMHNGLRNREACLLLPAVGGARLGRNLVRELLGYGAIGVVAAGALTAALVAGGQLTFTPFAAMWFGLLAVGSTAGLLHAAARGRRVRLASFAWPILAALVFAVIALGLRRLDIPRPLVLWGSLLVTSSWLAWLIARQVRCLHRDPLAAPRAG